MIVGGRSGGGTELAFVRKCPYPGYGLGGYGQCAFPVPFIFRLEAIENADTFPKCSGALSMDGCDLRTELGRPSHCHGQVVADNGSTRRVRRSCRDVLTGGPEKTRFPGGTFVCRAQGGEKRYVSLSYDRLFHGQWSAVAEVRLGVNRGETVPGDGYCSAERGVVRGPDGRGSTRTGLCRGNGAVRGRRGVCSIRKKG